MYISSFPLTCCISSAGQGWTHLPPGEMYHTADKTLSPVPDWKALGCPPSSEESENGWSTGGWGDCDRNVLSLPACPPWASAFKWSSDARVYEGWNHLPQPEPIKASRLSLPPSPQSQFRQVQHSSSTTTHHSPPPPATALQQQSAGPQFSLQPLESPPH